MSNEGYHEPIDEISDETRDMHRAIVSLMEELEAVTQAAAFCGTSRVVFMDGFEGGTTGRWSNTTP